MNSGPHYQSWQKRPSEGFQGSLTDLFIGLLFLFLLLLMYFATQLRVTVDDLLNTEITRDKLLGEVERYLEARDVPVEVDPLSGTILLTRSAMFRPGQTEPEAALVADLAVLSEAFSELLPCYTYHDESYPAKPCRYEEHVVEALMIDGHASAGVQGKAESNDDWALSTARAANVWRFMESAQPELNLLLNGPTWSPRSQQIFGVAGYAAKRPLSARRSGENADLDRRVEFRVVMRMPSAEPLPPELPKTTEDPEFDPAGGKRLYVRAGRTVTFQAGAGGEAYLDKGWSAPESWGVWSDQKIARIYIPLAKRLSGEPLDVSIRGVAFVSSNSPSREFAVSIDSGPRMTFQSNFPDNKLDLKIPVKAQDTTDRELIIRIEVLNPQSPRSVGDSLDGRTIGFGLTDVTLRLQD